MGFQSRPVDTDTAAFAIIAPVGNLLWLGGWIWLAARLDRAHVLSRMAAMAIPLSWICALPLARVGGGLVAGAIWLGAAWMLAGDRGPAGSTQPLTSGAPS